MISLNFILSIVTTTGYPELIIYNDYERLVCVILVYIGDALFALILGWYASNSSTLPEKYNYVFDRIRKMDYVLSDNRIPPKIRRKIENYFAYIVETRNKNKSCLEFLSGLLPSTTVKNDGLHYDKPLLVKRDGFRASKDFPEVLFTERI